MANERRFYLNMQFLKRCFILSFILMTFSCQKNEEEDFPIDYPSTYHCLRYENTSKIRLFAKNGEVTSSKIITRFYQNYGEYFLFKDNFSYQPSRPDSVHLISPNAAFFNEWEHGLDRKKEVLLLSPKDTFMAKLPIEYDFDLIMSIGKQKPIYQKVLQINANFGTYNLLKNLSNKLAYIKPNNQIEIPLLHYVLFHNSTSEKWVIKQRLYNRFDNSATLQIGSGDTLAIQEFRLLFEK